MADFIKYIAALFPGPLNQRKYINRKGPAAVFPFYHAVSQNELSHLKHLYKLRTPEQFEKDLDYMLKFFNPVKMSEFLSGKIPVDPHRIPMVLSFDDGLIQCYEVVMPILISKGVPATFFVNNAFIDNKALFYRFKISLLMERLEEVFEEQRVKAAQILHCEIKDIRKRLDIVNYVEREITDQVADAWNYSFSEYMRKDPVYLSSMHINKMVEEGFEFGSHGIDHPMFSLLKRRTTIDHIKTSMEDLKKRYKLDHKYFAFPFTDSGVQDATIEHLFRANIIDAGFGTAGLKDDKWPNYYQRIPMEQFDRDAKNVLRGEINRRRIRLMLGKNLVDRNAKPDDKD
ncbi:MAG: polysaccharide deacetylase family protein [Bacteroidales bacterium]